LSPSKQSDERESWFLRRPLQIERIRQGLPESDASEKLLRRLQHCRENLDAVIYALSSRQLAPDRRQHLLEILRRHQRALDECLGELGLVRPSASREPLAFYKQLDEVARLHLTAILGVPEEPDYYEVLDIKAEEYLAQREAFESLAAHQGYKERQTLSRTARKAALVMTLSGSLIQISAPRGPRSARRYLYQNIYGNAHPPEGVMVLDRDIRIAHRLRSVELTTSPVRLLRVVDQKVSWTVQSQAFERISRTLTSLVSRSSSQLAARGLLRASTAGVRVANLDAAERVLRQEYGEALASFRALRDRFLSEDEGDPHRVEAELLTLCHYLQTGARELGFDSRSPADLLEFVTEQNHVYRLDREQPGVITMLPRGGGPEVVFVEVTLGRQMVTRQAPLALIGRDGGVVEVTLPVVSLRYQ